MTTIQCDNEKAHKILSGAISTLMTDPACSKMRYYGYTLLLIQKNFIDQNSEVQLPTAGVGIKNDQYNLWINKDFWFDKVNINSPKKLIGLLIHETLHVLFNHPANLKSDEHLEPQLYNIACDLKINSIIVENMGDSYLPGCANTKIYRDVFKPAMDTIYQEYKDGNISKEELDEQLSQLPMRPVIVDDYEEYGLTSENCIKKNTYWIYNKLKENSNEISNNNSYAIQVKLDDNLKDLGTHKSWDKLDKLNEIEKEFLNANVKNLIKDVTDTFHEQLQGNLPSYVEEYLKDFLKPPKLNIDWKKALKKWVNTYGNFSEIKRTRSKPHLYIKDGRRLKFSQGKSIIVFIDTSGSMSIENIKEVLSEVANIKKNTNYKIYVTHIDADIHDYWELQSISQMKRHYDNNPIIGRGGTSYEPAVKFLKENPVFSGAIYCTDGYVDEPESKIPVPQINIITKNGQIPKWNKRNKAIRNIKIK